MILTLKQYWDNYLKESNMKKEDMVPVQYSETRKAFYGGIGSAMALMTEGIGALQDEDKAMESMQGIQTELRTFWEDEVKDYEQAKKEREAKGKN